MGDFSLSLKTNLRVPQGVFSGYRCPDCSQEAPADSHLCGSSDCRTERKAVHPARLNFKIPERSDRREDGFYHMRFGV